MGASGKIARWSFLKWWSEPYKKARWSFLKKRLDGCALRT
jgi:hypothetical protein